MAITKEMQRELANAARAANRRLERASQGQLDALEHNIKNYHTRTNAAGEMRFSQSKASTEAEYRQRMSELNKFMNAKTSTRKGWENVRRDSLSKANDKLSEMGYDVTDEELAQIAKETGGHNAAFYRALENVTAEKMAMYEDEEDDFGDIDEFIELNEKQLNDIIYQRRSDQQAAEQLIKQRQNGSKKNVPTGSKRRK